jgi:flagellar biosynthetic protein FlhB
MPAERDEKTEPPTPRRRREARTQGQVARSQDLTAAVLLLAGFLALALFGPKLWLSLVAIVRAALTAEHPTSLQAALPFASAVCVEAGKRIAPFLLTIFFAMLIALYAQVGLLLTGKPLVPSLSKINPLNGLKRLFSIRSVMMALINVGKLVVVGAVAYMMMAGSAAAIVSASSFDFRDVFRLGTSLAFELSMKLAAAMIVLALLDFAWQRYQHERDLRMTKEEVKDEFRSMEGDPHVKRRRREIQFQLAVQRLRRDVPKADVVVTNPTHVAVAVAYDADRMVAPKVMAKGADEVALRIRQIAKEHGIPIVERRTLARALFESVAVGEFIPERFYRAIAEILAYVYELTGRAPAGVRRELAGVT